MNEPKVIEDIRTGMTLIIPVAVGYVPPYISEDDISDENIIEIINTHSDSLTAVNEYIKTGKISQQYNKDGKKRFMMLRYAREITAIRKHIQKTFKEELQ